MKNREMIILPINLQLFAEGDDIDSGVSNAPDAEVQNNNDNIDTSAEDLDTGVSDDNSDPATQKPKQSPEADAAFAEIRRKAEAAEKKAAELEAKRQRDLEVAKKYGKDYGVYSEEDISEMYGKSHGIHTVEDLQRAILNEEYKAKGIDPDTINQMIENHPLIQEAKKTKENTEISNQYNKLLSDLKDDGLEGLVKNPEDVPQEVYQRWNFGKSGLSLSDCFYLAQRKQITAKRIEATKQSTLNNLAGKQHLKVEGDGASDANDISIPTETLQYYLDQNMDKKQAMAHYKKIYGGK